MDAYAYRALKSLFPDSSEGFMEVAFQSQRGWKGSGPAAGCPGPGLQVRNPAWGLALRRVLAWLNALLMLF